MAPRSKSRSAKKKRGPTPRRRPVDEPALVSPRYTPPPTTRFRPTWQKTVGWIQVAIGLLAVLVNYGAELGLDVMPGGHKEAYFLLGLFIAGSGTWWLGVFDRPTRQ